ncbi:hypothetical protein IU448_00150 [Nocardia flavorosea]|uniref:hypothetical protein n=1 Tax=Nocardia flavorosea TaxID=53429 RepID=UPI001893C7E3|nr:hypothetical protein [Nocardia flavorosea]MBF6347422.1 hypothetical protein [Nocardia flavorosea]
MGSEVIEPQSIRNVTVVGDPDATTRVVHRLLRDLTRTGTGVPGTVHWTTDRTEHTIRLAELSSQAPIAVLERSIRVADGLIAVLDAAAKRDSRLETALRIADDHQVARLCLVTGLDDPVADFGRCVRMVADAHGAAPVALQIPHGTGTGFDGAVDLISMRESGRQAPGTAGDRPNIAGEWYRDLVDTVTDPDDRYSGGVPGVWTIPAGRLHDRLRYLARIGDIVPVLCDTTPRRHIAPILDAIVRYLPSPLHVCQPEHVLDY